MSRFRQLLWMTPVVALVAITIRLGVWQLDRLEQRKASNAIALNERDMLSLDLNITENQDSSLDGRRIVVRGRFDASQEQVLRNRAHNEAPGIQLATPFLIDGSDKVLWVLRGFSFAPDGINAPYVAPPDPEIVQITGIGAAFPVTGDSGQPIDSHGTRSYRRLDSGLVRRLAPNSLDGFVYLEGDTAGPGNLPAVPPPTLDEGPHLSYAIQWFGIATAIFAFGWIMILRPRGGHGSAQPPEAP